MSHELIIWLFMIAACFVSVGLMVWSVRNEAIKGEKLEQAKDEIKNAVKQTEIANDQAKIASEKTTVRADNLDKLTRLSRRAPRTNKRFHS